VRAIAGLALLGWSLLAGGTLWLVALGVVVGAVLLVEAMMNYCPLARIWPWNREGSSAKEQLS